MKITLVGIQRFTQFVRQRARVSNVSSLSPQKKDKVTNQMHHLEINKEVVLRRQFCVVVEIEIVFLLPFVYNRHLDRDNDRKHLPCLYCGCDSELLPNRSSHGSRSKTLHQERLDSGSKGNARQCF